jgi:hypothetical protein
MRRDEDKSEAAERHPRDKGYPGRGRRAALSYLRRMYKPTRAWHPAFQLLLILFVALVWGLGTAPFLATGWAFVVSWASQSKFGHIVVCVLALVVAVVALGLRHVERFKYGTIEVVAGVAGAWFACDATTPWLGAAGIFGAIYVMVRGLDNMVVGYPEILKEPFEDEHPRVSPMPIARPGEARLPGAASSEPTDKGPPSP